MVLLLLLPLFIIIIAATAIVMDHIEERGVVNIEALVDIEMVPLVPKSHAIAICPLGGFQV